MPHPTPLLKKKGSGGGEKVECGWGYPVSSFRVTPWFTFEWEPWLAAKFSAKVSLSKTNPSLPKKKRGAFCKKQS
jgi:hypothetical protein